MVQTIVLTKATMKIFFGFNQFCNACEIDQKSLFTICDDTIWLQFQIQMSSQQGLSIDANCCNSHSHSLVLTLLTIVIGQCQLVEFFVRIVNIKKPTKPDWKNHSHADNWDEKCADKKICCTKKCKSLQFIFKLQQEKQDGFHECLD